MKILTVVGARPQFIKAAVGSRIFRKEHKEILVHTGQHHDENMSDVFFEELDIPKPDYNLGIAGGSHGQMTGRMLMDIEDIIGRESPDIVLVYGDTNSTLSAALAAVKLCIPVVHIEAGNRFGTLESPEEVNRIVTDHVSTLRFACTESAYNSLVAENLKEESYLCGDPMLDAFNYYRKMTLNRKFEMTGIHNEIFEIPNDYYYMTCHRQENTKDFRVLAEVLSAMNELDAPTIYPVHPRNRAMVQELVNTRNFSNVICVNPVGYLESIKLVSGAKKIVTDSGGLQREAFFAEKQCVTILGFVVWPETMVGNRNQLAKPERADILNKLSVEQHLKKECQPFGDGHSVEKIYDIINGKWGMK